MLAIVNLCSVQSHVAKLIFNFRVNRSLRINYPILRKSYYIVQLAVHFIIDEIMVLKINEINLNI